jgi:hypothetical protein
MPKPNKKTIEPLLDEWAKLRAQADKIEQSRDLEIKVLQEHFDRKCASIRNIANGKLAPLQEKLKSLTEKIAKPLLDGVAEDGTIALPQVIGERAFASVNTKSGPREIDAVRFFDHTPVAKRDSIFWSCVKILVAPAEKLLGKVELDKLSDRSTSHEVEIKMKSS